VSDVIHISRVKTAELKERCKRFRCSAGDVFENPVLVLEERSEFLPRKRGVELPCEQEFEYFATSSLLDFATKYYAVSGFFFPSGRQRVISHVFCSVTFKHSILVCFKFRILCLILEFWSVRNEQRPHPLQYIFSGTYDQLGSSVFLFLNSKTVINCVTGSAIGQKLLVDVEMSQSVNKVARCNDFEFALH